MGGGVTEDPGTGDVGVALVVDPAAGDTGVVAGDDAAGDGQAAVKAVAVDAAAVGGAVAGMVLPLMTMFPEEFSMPPPSAAPLPRMSVPVTYEGWPPLM